VIVDVTARVKPAVRARVAAEVAAAFEVAGVRRELRVDATGGTPRRYRVLTRDAIFRYCPHVRTLYGSDALLDLVSETAGERAFRIPYAPEEFVATRLERPGDTHGWHWDDYAFALVWVLAAPPASAGGILEVIAGVPWEKSAVDIDAVLAAREPERHAFASGSVYLLRADNAMHRVTPLLGPGRRDALCFTYACANDLGRSISHETLEQIYAASA
jgi:hypothetical protein